MPRQVWHCYLTEDLISWRIFPNFLLNSERKMPLNTVKGTMSRIWPMRFLTLSISTGPPESYLKFEISLEGDRISCVNAYFTMKAGPQKLWINSIRDILTSVISSSVKYARSSMSFAVPSSSLSLFGSMLVLLGLNRFAGRVILLAIVLISLSLLICGRPKFSSLKRKRVPIVLAILRIVELKSICSNHPVYKQTIQEEANNLCLTDNWDWI